MEHSCADHFVEWLEALTGKKLMKHNDDQTYQLGMLVRAQLEISKDPESMEQSIKKILGVGR